MNAEVKTILFPTSDLEASKRLFGRLLGVEPVADAPYYVGFEVGDMHIGLDPGGDDRGMTGATPFFDVDDIRAAAAQLKSSGADVVEDVHEVGDGLLVAMLSDADGNMIGLRQTPKG